ncbi:ABC transporter permease [candidate division KSB1 bacterium]
MGKKEIKYPKIATWILTNFIQDFDQRFLIGDLKEIYITKTEEKGQIYSRVWFWLFVLSSIPCFVKKSLYWRFTMFKNYIKTAFRNMKRKKVFSFINIAGLTIGMTCCILILLWVQDELSYDRFHRNADNIYIVVSERERDSESFYIQTTPAPTAPTMKEKYPEVIEAARYRNLGKRLIRHEQIFDIEEDIAFADPSIFEIFTFPFVKGNPENALEDLYSIVITEDMAEKYFGDENPVGKTLFFGKELGMFSSSDYDLTVKGVIKNIPSNSSINFDFIVPFELLGKIFNRDLSGWNFSFGFRSFILLKDGTDYKGFNKKISGFIKQSAAAWNVKTLLKPMVDIYRRGYNNDGVIKSVYIFTSLAILTLIIACLNFINLSTARSSNRAKEVGMRKVIGARRTELFIQFLGESVFISVISLVAAVVLVYLLLPVFNSFSGKLITIDMSKNLFSLIVIAVIILFTGILSGAYPALVLSAFQPTKILKGSNASGSKTSSVIRKILVTIQFSISILLIICTIVISRQLHFVRNTDLGFDKEHLLYIEMNDVLKSQYEVFKGDLLRNPKIKNVTGACSALSENLNYSQADWEGKPEDTYLTTAINPVSYDYFETMSMKFVEGRGFSREISSDASQAYVITEEAVKVMKLDSPVGKRFSVWGREGKIVGIVKDFYYEPLYHGAFPTVYLYSQQRINSIIIKINSENIPQTISDIEMSFKKFNPEYPFVFNFVDETIDGFYRSELQMEKVFKTFAFLAVFIACLGMFGLSAFVAEKRTKEIGIRKVLGASTGTILNLLSGNFIILVVLANIIAVPIGYYFMNRWLESFVYHINIEWWVFVLSGLLAIVTAVLTVSYQSIKAAKANPVDTLSYE